MIIYLATNSVNGKIYVGKTVLPLARRWQNHLYQVRRGCGYYFHRAIRKYGVENFSLQVLETAISIEELIALEKYWIATLGSNSSTVGYNETKGGEGWHGKHSLAARKQMSQTRRGRVSPFKNKRHSLESRAFIAQNRSGKYFIPEDHKIILRAANRGNRNAATVSPFSKQELIVCITAGMQIGEIARKFACKYSAVKYRAQEFLGSSIRNFKKQGSLSLCEAL